MNGDFICLIFPRGGLLLAVLALLGAVLPALAPSVATAAPVVLEDIEYGETDSEWKFEILFSIPVRHLRHSPERRGSDIEISLEALDAVDLVDLLMGGPEVLGPPERSGLALRDIRLEAGADGRPLLLVRFWQDVSFRIEAGSDFRRLALWLPKEKSQRTPATAAADTSKSQEILDEARRAMVARQYDRAIALYTLFLRSSAAPADPQTSDAQTREALEYLGLARQKNGQIAHARAEYEAYLARFPEGEGSDRVRQRLSALSTASSAAAPTLESATARPSTEFDFHGSVYTAYFRTESFADLSGAELVDSSQHLDADVSARLRRGAFEMRGRAAGYLRYDYDAADSAVPSRVTRLYLEARDRSHGLIGTIGRQSSHGAGVLSRLDGLTASWTFLPDWTVKGVAGFPLLGSVSNEIDTSQQVYGLSMEAGRLLPGLSAELYAVGQFVEGTTDRIALGIEARYLDSKRSAYGLLDFDAYFVEVNIAMFSGSWRVTDSTTLNALVDYRYSPVLTSRNALIGQPFSDLEDLETTFSSSEIQNLARDRTPRVTTLVAGAAHRIHEGLEINGDFTASQIGGTPASGSVPGYAASDWFFYYTAQLVSWGWLTENGSERLGLRFFDGDRYDAFALSLSGRYPLPYDFRLSPELRFEYRTNRGSQDFVEIDPMLRIEYRFRRLVLDTEFAFQWLRGVGGTSAAPVDEELGYLLNVGLRYDF